MQVGMAKYEQEFPHAGLMLVEPNRNDEQMFFTNIFSYARATSWSTTLIKPRAAELLARADELEAFLEPYELGLNRNLLQQQRSFNDAMRQERPYLAPVGNNLARGLDRLEKILGK
jgi:NTE family protein